jgi:hypothetical protein
MMIFNMVWIFFQEEKRGNKINDLSLILKYHWIIMNRFKKEEMHYKAEDNWAQQESKGHSCTIIIWNQIILPINLVQNWIVRVIVRSLARVIRAFLLMYLTMNITKMYKVYCIMPIRRINKRKRGQERKYKEWLRHKMVH